MSEAAVIAPVRRNLDEIVDRVATWLGSRMPETTGMHVTDLSYPLGAGLSNETILFEAAWSEGATPHTGGFVLRLEPDSYRVYMEIDFKGQFELQRTLAAIGLVPVPETLWFEEDTSLFGARFFVMRRLRGKVAVSYPPYATHGWVAEATTEQRRQIWEGAITALATLYKVPLASIGMLDRPEYGQTGWEQEWNYWMKSYSWSAGARRLQTCEQVIDWLKATMPAEKVSGLCWGDSRIGNLMFADDFTVLAVMDWEGASLGGAMQDLGFWRFLDDIVTQGTGVLPEGFGSRDETIALWERVSGGSARDIFWYEIFAGLKLASHVSRKLTLDGNSRPGFNYGDNPATRLLASKLGLPAPVEVL